MSEWGLKKEAATKLFERGGGQSQKGGLNHDTLKGLIDERGGILLKEWAETPLQTMH